MTHKKNFLQRLFTHEEGTGLTGANRMAIMNSLKEDYGLTIQQDNMTVEELSALRFRRISGDELARVNQVFQYIPQIVVSNVNQHAVNTAFKAATEGTFHVRLGAGMHLCRSRFTPDAYRGIGLSDVTNQVAGSAELLVNDAALTVSKAPQIALEVFNIASLATGQYFMSQINTKISELSLSVGRVERLLDARRYGELRETERELSDIIAKIEFTINNTDKINSAIDQIHHIQHLAGTEMNTCRNLLSDELREMKPSDKVDQIKKRIESIVHHLVEYQYATQLYGIATLLEVQLRNHSDPDELRTDREQIDRRVNQFKQDYDKCYEAINTYINQTHVLNDKNIVQFMASSAAGALSILATGKIGAVAGFGEKVFSSVEDWFSDRRKQQKEKITIRINECFEPLGDMLLLESPSSTIDRYIETVGQEIEFVKIGDDYYTNLPEM